MSIVICFILIFIVSIILFGLIKAFIITLGLHLLLALLLFLKFIINKSNVTITPNYSNKTEQIKGFKRILIIFLFCLFWEYFYMKGAFVNE